MLLYDVFYKDGSFDRSIPLPKKPNAGTRYAICVNGDHLKYVPRRGLWESDEQLEAIKNRAYENYIDMAVDRIRKERTK